MKLKNLELNGFKSFAKKTILHFEDPIVAIVGPNGSGKSNVVEALRFVLGEQSIKSMRGSLGSDLIFKGSAKLPKMARASVVVYFDNKDKVFKLPNDKGEYIDLNYDIVSISREVYTDGLNKYMLNTEEVRLKDINTLLSSVNIGSSGHHIISQGEADRILNSSSKDRREMIEDALGLKIYQYKIKEAKRKLERTANNMKEVGMQKRENIPHLNFLKKQVDKFEKAKEMRVTLGELYREYLKKESLYLDKEEKNLIAQKNHIGSSLNLIGQQLKNFSNNDLVQETEKEKELKILENRIYSIRGLKSEVERKLGRIEGMIEMGEQKPLKKADVFIPEDRIKDIFNSINRSVDQAITIDNLSEVRILLTDLKNLLHDFSSNNFGSIKNIDISEDFRVVDLKKDQVELLKEINKIKEEERTLIESIEKLKSEIYEENANQHAIEKERFELRVKNQELTSSLEIIQVKEESLRREKESFENEIKEGGVLIGGDIFLYRNYELEGDIDRNSQEELRRSIERIKIKLEDVGGGAGEELMKEFEEVSKRDEFLAKELDDLSKSIDSLKLLMNDLKDKIDSEFKGGIDKINVEFNNFFNLMFGGGHAKLEIVLENKRKKEEYEEGEEIDEISFEQGIDINVSLPQKKVKALNALSGGERSLTSIALLFAMSQVNPPPFLVLDETDAALDEANSRKYGDMLEKLSKHSQLVVVTHNRETMSRAGILYGVTIGSDGASKLLSVKLDVATQIAK